MWAPAMHPAGHRAGTMQHFSSSSSMHRLQTPTIAHRSSRHLALPVLSKVTTKQTATSKQQQAASVKGRSTKLQRGSTVSGTKTVRGREQQAALQQQQQPSKNRGSRFYFNITGFPFPLGPFFERNTVRNEIVKGQVWTFEQTQSFFFDVYTPVRMTVIKLKSGGLWVHGPVAPTEECINLLKELDAPVEYIVLPTYAYEHKVFVAPFSRRFPDAKVYVAPCQWSLPLNLPNEWLGIFPAGELVDGDDSTPWADEIEQKVLLPPRIGGSKVVRITEVSFFHKASRTLLVTDAVLYVDKDPPACIPDKALRSQAQDGWLQKFLAGGRSKQQIDEVARKGLVEDSQEARRTAWARMSLLVLYFNPSDLLTPQESFDAISQQLLVGPVVRTLVYDKIPNTVCDWVDSMCADWRFERIIPAHFSAPVRAGPAELREAFRFAYDQVGRTPGGSGSSSSKAGSSSGSSNPFSSLFSFLGGSSQSKVAVKNTSRREDDGFPEDDVKVLKRLNQLLIKLKIVFTDAEKRAGIDSSNSKQQ